MLPEKMQLPTLKRVGEYPESEEGGEATQVPMLLHFPSNCISLML